MDAAEKLARLRALMDRLDEAKQDLQLIEGLPFEARRAVSQHLTDARTHVLWIEGRLALATRAKAMSAAG